MKTKLSLFIVICCVALLLASCAVASGKQTEPSAAKSDPSEATISDSTAGQTEPSEEHPTIIPLEPDKKDLPSYADLSRVKPGMTKDEVFALVGNPQREVIRRMPVYEATSLATDTICHIYDSNDGDSICVLWGYANAQSASLVVLTVVTEVSE